MKKKVYAILLAMLLIVMVMPISTFAEAAKDMIGNMEALSFDGGNGTEENPYQIATKAQLNSVRDYPNANYVLTQDIVFEDKDFEEGGEFYNYKGTFYAENGNVGNPYDDYGWLPIENFSGTFDGAGHAIVNLKFAHADKDKGKNYGLFSVNNGQIKNLGVMQCDFLSHSYTSVWMGGICGTNYGTIENCYVTGKVHIDYAFADAGGICAVNESGAVIQECVNMATVKVEQDVPNAGGLVCRNNGTITDSMNFGRVICEQADFGGNASGIAVSNSGAIINVFNFGAVMAADNHMAGLAATSNGIIENAYLYKNFVPVTTNEKKAIDVTILSSKTINSQVYDGLNQTVWIVDNTTNIPYLSKNPLFSRCIDETTDILTSVDGFSGKGYTYKSIELTWTPVSNADGYILYRADGEGAEYRELAIVEGNQTTSYIDSKNIVANSSNRYLYRMSPYFDYECGRYYGMISGAVPAMVVDTNSDRNPDDMIAPSLTDFEVVEGNISSPGVLKVRVAATSEKRIDEIQLSLGNYETGEYIKSISKSLQGTLSGQIDVTVDFPINSAISYGKYQIIKLMLFDELGNELSIDPRVFDETIIVVEPEFDIEFTGFLSSTNVVTQLQLMEEGKTVALTIDKKSEGILKKELLDAIKGKDKTIVVYGDAEGSSQWVFYGRDINGTTKDLDLNTKVEKVSASIYGGSGFIIQINYADNGMLPGRVNFRLKSDYIKSINGLDDNLYLYYLNGKRVNMESSNCQVIRDGSSYWCYLDLEHNSKFLLSAEELKHPISAQSATLSYTTTTYSGSEKKPEVSIKGLIKDKDYIVAYKNNTNAGMATVVITGKGSYAGTLTKNFTINAKQLPDAELSYTATTYSGSAKKPGVAIKGLSKDKDYSVTYKNNTNAGTATVKITGKGNYKGSVTKTFTIKPKKITSATLGVKSYFYNGEIKKPTVTVKSDKKVLLKAKKVDSKEIDLTYAKGRRMPGEYKVTIKGKGNYTGTITKSFNIKVKNATISNVASGKKQFTVKWKALSKKNISGYEICYSSTKKFTKATTKYVKVKNYKHTSKKITKLKAKKPYYVKIRTYKIVNGKSYYSAWSKYKTVITKK